MSKLKFLSENFLTQYNSNLSMVVGTENNNFPLSNLKRKFTTKVFRSNENNCEILIDMLQLRECDNFVAVGSAITGFGSTTITIQGSATTNFTGVTPISVDINTDHNIAKASFNPVSVRYWKINISGTGSYCELSNLFIGKAEILENNSISVSSFRLRTNDRSTTRTNQYGQEFTDKRNKQRSIRGTIQYCNKEEVETLENILLRHTDRTPIWVMIDCNNTIADDGEFRYSGYFSYIGGINWSSTGVGLFNISLRFDEVV
jgi:hypothetical protein